MKSIIYLLLITFSGIACNTDAITEPKPQEQDTGNNNNSTKPQAGFVSGKVVDLKNRPVANATIIANNSDYYNHAVIGTTDASGNYKIKLPTGIGAGSFYIRGSVQVKYHGKPYDLSLFTENDGEFSPYVGAIKNLTLKLTGARTGNFGDDGFYGGILEIENNANSVEKGDIEVTLVPDGPLVDGSVGQTIIRRSPADDYYIYDIAVGKYKITAKDLTTGKRLAVKIRDDGKEYGQTTTGIFVPPYETSERFKLALQIIE